MKALLGLLVAVGMGCAPKGPDGPRAYEVPFIHGPAVTWTDDPSAGYHVELSVALQRNITPEDHVAFVVRVGADEVGRYPIKKGEIGTTIHQRVEELPLGDYTVELEYNNERFTGEAFRIAQVPEWGGSTNTHLFRHHGTRVSLIEKKLWVLRWWPNDAPTQPWVIEWRHEGVVVTTTSGRERKWAIADSNDIVRYALQPQARRSIWQLGEEYALPDQVGKLAGSWEARILHAGAPPVSIGFTVLPGGKIGEADKDYVATGDGWTRSWSQQLALRPLAQEDIVELSDKLVGVTGGQQLAPAPIVVTPQAVRALFRSKELADQWSKFLGGSSELRSKVEALIKAQGGPWKPDEFPKS
ncbi:MAG: hypothetical protein QM831_44095 [Kofleriaceae bacterium]